MKKLIFMYVFLVSILFLGKNPIFSQGSERLVSLVSDIEIHLLEDETLLISWKKPKNTDITNLAIYKSKEQLALSDLYIEKPLAYIAAKDEHFIDKDFANELKNNNWDTVQITTYYLVSYQNEKEIIPVIIPGRNAGSFLSIKNNAINGNAPIVQSKQIAVNTDTRSIYPLPKKILHSTDKENEALLIPTENFDALKSQSTKQLRITEIRVFEDDLNAKAGEAYLLAEILQKDFMFGRYRETEEAIRSFLMIHRSQEIHDKSLFYLAQALYFQERYVDALYYFIECQSYLFDISRDWIDACLYILSE